MAAAAEKAQAVLDGGTTLFAGAAAAGLDLADVRELQLLTAKPFLYVFNEDDAELADDELRAAHEAGDAGFESIFLDAKTESELAELEPAGGSGAAGRPSLAWGSRAWRSWPGPTLRCGYRRS